MAKFVATNEYIELPSGTDRSNQFSSFIPEPVRAEIDAAVFGDESDRFELGVFSNTVTSNVRPDADWAFLKYLIQQMDSGADVAVLYRPKAGAKATDNPEMTFNIKISKLPPLGAARGELLGGQVQWKVNGPITWDDGVDTIVLG